MYFKSKNVIVFDLWYTEIVAHVYQNHMALVCMSEMQFIEVALSPISWKF